MTTLLGVWAHPDDEAYLSAGLMAEARERGERVVVVTATLGDHGTSDPSRWPPSCLRRVRRRELQRSLAVIGVDELRIIGIEDGMCDQVDASDVVAGHIAEIAPDRIVTFGPDGITNHPDHVAVSRWTTKAWAAAGARAELWHATKAPDFHVEFGAINDAIGLWADQPRPPCTPAHLCHTVHLDDEQLARKLAALHAHASQTVGLVAAMGRDVYREWVRTEWFVPVPVTR